MTLSLTPDSARESEDYKKITESLSTEEALQKALDDKSLSQAEALGLKERFEKEQQSILFDTSGSLSKLKKELQKIIGTEDDGMIGENSMGKLQDFIDGKKVETEGKSIDLLKKDSVDYQKSIKKLNEDILKLQNQIGTENDTQNNSLRSQVKKLSTEIKTLSTSNNNLSNDIKKLTGEISKLEQTIKNNKGTLSETQIKLQENNTKLEVYLDGKDINDIKKDLKNTNNDINKTKIQKNGIPEAKEAINKQIKETNRDLGTNEKSFSKNAEKISTLEKDTIPKLKTQIETLKTEKQKNELSLTQYNTELDLLNNESLNLEESLKKAKRDEMGLKNEYESKKSSKNRLLRLDVEIAEIKVQLEEASFYELGKIQKLENKIKAREGQRNIIIKRGINENTKLDLAKYNYETKKEDRKKIETKINENKNKIVILKEKINNTNTNIKLSNNNNKIQTIENSLKTKKSEKDSLIAKNLKLGLKIKENIALIESYTTAKNSIDNDDKEYGQKLQLLKKQKDILDKKIKNINSLNKNNTTLKQNISNLKTSIKKDEDTLKNNNDNLNTITNNFYTNSNDITTKQEEINTTKSTIENKQQQIKEETTRIEELNNKLTNINVEIVTDSNLKDIISEIKGIDGTNIDNEGNGLYRINENFLGFSPDFEIKVIDENNTISIESDYYKAHNIEFTLDQKGITTKESLQKTIKIEVKKAVLINKYKDYIDSNELSDFDNLYDDVKNIQSIQNLDKNANLSKLKQGEELKLNKKVKNYDVFITNLGEDRYKIRIDDSIIPFMDNGAEISNIENIKDFLSQINENDQSNFDSFKDYINDIVDGFFGENDSFNNAKDQDNNDKNDNDLNSIYTREDFKNIFDHLPDNINNTEYSKITVKGKKYEIKTTTEYKSSDLNDNVYREYKQKHYLIKKPK